MPRLTYTYIDNQSQLEQFCRELEAAETIAFDTEFVSEDSYRPHLCLIQVAAQERLAAIDPLACDDMTPFWRLITREGHATIVHAGREEFRFCRLAVEDRPEGWFDTQLAAAFIGLEFPAAYHNLVSKLLKQRLGKAETRTDWRRRPLTERQIEYALQDVIYLEPLSRELRCRIRELGRESWLAEEHQAWQKLVEDYDDREQWRRVSGISGLTPRGLAIVRELWRWREREAQSRDCPSRRVLRDDLIVELARRESSDVRRIRAVRGLERGNLKRHLENLAKCVQQAMELPPDALPPATRRAANNATFTLLGQFLNTALGCICRANDLAPTLVGTIQDVRDLIAYRLETHRQPASGPPALIQGWRAEVVGRQIDEVLQGRLAIRVAEPLADQPLEFVPLPETAQGNPQTS